jgi:ribose-phosphate pyrophosphokinase
MSSVTSGGLSPDGLRKAATGDTVRLFALEATRDLGKAVALDLGCELAAHEERSFEDGEHKVRPLDAVGGVPVYVVQSLHGGPSSANDALPPLFLSGSRTRERKHYRSRSLSLLRS